MKTEWAEPELEFVMSRNKLKYTWTKNQQEIKHLLYFVICFLWNQIELLII